ncbi:conserved uncharacterized protein, DUF58 [Desulfosarcina variabilis str. Montpellier]|uniref:DUF58 domain-containing protein n=1 Tax=Desulfosarcina variabilis TaxID=2300 RepID=UPI003AFA2662
MSLQEYQPPSIYTTLFIQFFVGLFFFIALLNGQRDLALLTLIVLVVMTCARLWSRASLRGLSIRTSVDRTTLFPGDELRVRVWARNKKWLPVRLHMEILVHGDSPSIETLSDLKIECGLLWYQQVNFQWKRKVSRRGVFQLGSTRLTAGDFFGFFLSAQKRAYSPIEIVVYPRIVPLKPFSFVRKDYFGLPGANTPVQDPIYILGTRDYQCMQPARYIHWKASARHMRLQEKVFEPSAQTKVLLLLDVASFADQHAHEAFEHSIEVLASLAVQCERNGYAFGFSTNGHVGKSAVRLSVSHGNRKLSAVLTVLARLRMEGTLSLSESLCIDGAIRRAGSAVCFAYQDNADIQAVRDFFSQRRIPMDAVVCHRQGDIGAKNGRTFVLDELTIGAGCQ